MPVFIHICSDDGCRLSCQGDAEQPAGLAAAVGECAAFQVAPFHAGQVDKGDASQQEHQQEDVQRLPQSGGELPFPVQAEQGGHFAPVECALVF